MNLEKNLMQIMNDTINSKKKSSLAPFHSTYDTKQIIQG
jgi:hypothetical protein